MFVPVGANKVSRFLLRRGWSGRLNEGRTKRDLVKQKAVRHFEIIPVMRKPFVYENASKHDPKKRDPCHWLYGEIDFPRWGDVSRET